MDIILLPYNDLFEAFAHLFGRRIKLFGRESAAMGVNPIDDLLVKSEDDCQAQAILRRQFVLDPGQTA